MQLIYSDQPLYEGEAKSVFLAGPTPRNKSVISWRKEAIKLFEEKGFEGVLFIPEATEGIYADYTHQIDWELYHLEKADIILFWIPRDLVTMPAFTTNVEFGFWLKSGKCVYGRPDDSPKNKYLDYLYKKYYTQPIYDTLESLISPLTSVAGLESSEKRD
jgi:nucleoside 2-deoxyribosyltransferase